MRFGRREYKAQRLQEQGDGYVTFFAFLSRIKLQCQDQAGSGRFDTFFDSMVSPKRLIVERK